MSEATIERLEERIADLEDRLIEAQSAPWPEWAEKLLRILESFGAEYEADDEINLPDELTEWLHHYASDLKQTARAALSQAQPQPSDEVDG